VEVFVPPPRYNKVTKSESTKSRLFRLLLIVTFTLTIAFFPLLHSQEGVRIKERVEIGSREISRTDYLIIKDNLKTSGVVSGFVMPKSGELQVYYSFCNRIDRMLPANAALVVHFLRGDSSRSDRIISRFPNVTPWSRLIYNACYGIHQYRYQYNYTNTGYAEDVYVYNVGAVTEGDTIQLFYSSNSIVTGDSVLYGIYSADSVAPGSWNVVFGDYDWCIGDFNDVLNIYVGVEEKKSCEDAPQCSDAIQAPLISIQTHPNGYRNVDACSKNVYGEGKTVGVFVFPLGMQPLNVEPCYNPNANRWQFSVPEIEIDAIMDICPQNLPSNNVLIEDANHLKTLNLTGLECEQAKKDFLGHSSYPIEASKYVLKPVLMMHEEMHRSQREDIFVRLYEQWKKKFNSYQPNCEEFADIEHARSSAKAGIGQLVDEFIDKEFYKEFKERYYDTKAVVDPKNPNYDAEVKRKNQNDIDNQKSDLMKQIINDIAGYLSCN